MKKRSALFIILFLTFTTGVFAQSKPMYSADLIPTELKSRAGAVIRNMETTVDMRTPENVILTIKKTITILNKSGEERAALNLYYNKNSAIKSIKGYIMDATGNPTGKFNQSNFTDESASNDYSLFEDARIKSFMPNPLSFPYTVTYEYEVRYKQNLIIPDWYANPYADVSVENTSYTFICKPEDKIRIKAYNYKGEPEEIIKDKTRVLKWKAINLTAFKREPYSPDPDNYLTYVKIASERFSYYNYKGKYNNWNELGKWVYDDLIKSRQDLGSEAINTIRKLVEGINSDHEKVKKVYEFMQKKTRYISIQVGIGGFQPFPASDVDRLSYGDCKALVNYTQSLLTAIGINSLYCVVNAGSMKKSMDPDFASMDQGNHIILCVPLKTDSIWLECTSQHSPFGYLGTFTDDRTVFACTEQGGRLLKTPSLPPAANLLNRSATLIINEDGDINGSMLSHRYGSQYDDYEQIIQQPYPEQLKLLKNEYDIDNINFTEVKISQDKKENNPVTTESLKLTIGRFISKSGNRIYLIPNAFNKTRSIPEARNRTLPVYINRGYTDEDEITYELPSGYTVEHMPADVSLKTVFGTYHMTLRFEGTKLIYKRNLSINNGTFEAHSYESMVGFFSAISGYDNAKVVMKIK